MKSIRSLLCICSLAGLLFTAGCASNSAPEDLKVEYDQE